jgi:hypothetical protein
MPPTTPIEDQVAALAGAVDRMTKRQAAHGDQIRDLAGHVTDLFERVKTGPAGAGDDTPGVCWLTATDAPEAYRALADLVEWIEAVYRWYPDGDLPSCWLWHPWVVEELLALRAAHASAYKPKAPPREALDWHDKHRPNVAARIDKVLGSHSLELHDRPMLPDGVPASDPITVSRVVPEWTDHKRVPEPTPGELTDATDYELVRQRHKSDRDHQV